nr:hypothetical protein [Deltaproteobacteria bacterium]
GGLSTNVAIGAYGVLGAYGEFDDIHGDSLVASAGISAGIPETPISVGGSLGLVTNLSGTAIGATISAAVSLGLDAITPIDLGGLACHTEVIQTQ